MRAGNCCQVGTHCVTIPGERAYSSDPPQPPPLWQAAELREILGTIPVEQGAAVHSVLWVESQPVRMFWRRSVAKKFWKESDMHNQSATMVKMLFLVSLAFFSTNSSAASIRCSPCSEATARALALQSGVGSHLIFDFAAGQVWRFNVEYDAEFARYLALHAQPTAQDQDLANKLRALYIETSGAMRKQVEVSSDSFQIMGLGGANVYDVLFDRNLRVRIEDRLDTPFPTAGADGVRMVIAALMAGGEKYTGLKGQVSMEVRIRFVDGSSMVFRVSAEKRGGEYVIGSARRADGSGVVEGNSRDYQGVYHIESSMEYEDFLRQARSYGIPVTGAGPGSYRCSFDGSTLNCVLQAI